MTTCPACSRPVAEGKTYHIQCEPYEQITALKAALTACMEWAGSDCEHEACKAIIEIARAALSKTEERMAEQKGREGQ